MDNLEYYQERAGRLARQLRKLLKDNNLTVKQRRDILAALDLTKK